MPWNERTVMQERLQFIARLEAGEDMSALCQEFEISAENPNDLWCIDFKGQFRTGDRIYCYPLTITDRMSRYALGCEALTGVESEPVFRVFEEVFEE